MEQVSPASVPMSTTCEYSIDVGNMQQTGYCASKPLTTIGKRKTNEHFVPFMDCFKLPKVDEHFHCTVCREWLVGMVMISASVGWP